MAELVHCQRILNEMASEGLIKVVKFKDCPGASLVHRDRLPSLSDRIEAVWNLQQSDESGNFPLELQVNFTAKVSKDGVIESVDAVDSVSVCRKVPDANT